MKVRWLALAIALLALGWWLLPGVLGSDDPELADESTRADETDPARLAGRGPGDSEVERVPVEPGTESKGVAGWLVVRVRCDTDHEQLGSAQVYVLPAGEPGTDDISKVPHASIEINNEALTIPVLWPGRYDVGAACDWGAKVLEDVEVPAGARVEVEVTLPPPSVIQVQMIDDWPIEGLANLRGWVKLEATSTDGRLRFPGRGQKYAPDHALHIWTGLQGTRVPAGITYQPAIRLVSPVPSNVYATSIFRMVPGAPGLVLEPTKLEAGDRAQVGLPDLVEVPLRITLAGDWPKDARTSLELRAQAEHWQNTISFYREMRRGWFDRRKAIEMKIVVHARDAFALSWHGSDIEQGVIERFDKQLRVDEPNEIKLRYSPRDGLELLNVHVPDNWTEAKGRLVAFSKESRRQPRIRGGAGPTMTLNRVWRRHGLLQAISKDGHISEPVTMPMCGDATIRWKQGGWVKVSGTDPFPDTAGALIVRRTDGGVFYEDERFRRETYIEDDDMLGPFLPGTLELDVFAGRRLLKRYRLEIKPNVVTDLRLP